MSEENIEVVAPTPVTKPARRRSKPKKETAGRTSGRKPVDTTFLAKYIESLEVNVSPSIHINGHQHSSALLTVDFGSPLEHVKLSPEQNQELSERMRTVARDIIGKEAVIRISHDGLNGIFWASLV